MMLLASIDKVQCDNDDEDEPEDEKEDEPKIPIQIPPGMQTIKFNPADLTEEDQHSQHMPRDLKCDGCRIIAYKVSFAKFYLS